jgi:hypothetical protein
MAQIVLSLHRNKNFAGDLMDCVRIYPDLNVSYLFGSPHLSTFGDGLHINKRHFRYVVASVICK